MTEDEIIKLMLNYDTLKKALDEIAEFDAEVEYGHGSTEYQKSDH